MLRLLIDENLNHRILRGLKLRVANLDYVVVQSTQIRGTQDSVVLNWAAQQDRVLVTHDAKTIPKFAHDRVRANQPMPGVILVPGRLPIGPVIEELATLIECCEPADLENLILYLPL